MVMWVCEAWQVNIWTVFAVRPNGPNKNNKKNKNNFASSRSDHLGSDKNLFEYISIFVQQFLYICSPQSGKHKMGRNQDRLPCVVLSICLNISRYLCNNFSIFVPDRVERVRWVETKTIYPALF